MQKPPIIEAAESGDLRRIREIIRTPGSNINATNSVGQTAAIIAAIRNNYEMLRILFEAGADFNRRGNNNQSAMDWVRAHDNKEILRLLEQRHR